METTLYHEPNSTEFVNKEVINRHPTVRENSQRGVGGYDVGLNSQIMGFRPSTESDVQVHHRE